MSKIAAFFFVTFFILVAISALVACQAFIIK